MNQLFFLTKATRWAPLPLQAPACNTGMKTDLLSHIVLRRSLWFGLALLCMATLFAAGQTPRPATLAVGNVPGYPGTTVNVPISVRQATNDVAAQFDLAYSPERTTPGTAVLAPAHAGHTVRSREVAPGVHRTLVYSMNNALLRTNGFRSSIPFQLPPGERAGSAPITPGNVILARRDATAIAPVVTSRGAVFTQPVNALPDGTVQFFLPSQPDAQYVIQATTDFVQWVNLTNTTATGDFMDLVDVDAATYPHRYYRSALSEVFGQFGSPTVLPDGRLTFAVVGRNGRSYTLQSSTNLVHWENLSTVTPSDRSVQVTNAITPQFPARFFRLRSAP